ncbi:MAG: type VI secretion system baseplate subunit TssG [Planctomycetaceae bacterium]|nr:type VI secretion system baseplate subunit TssG [Planctomycetaceae bacterium]
MVAAGRGATAAMTLPADLPSPDSVAAKLFANPFMFDFFQAVRLLELTGGKQVGREGPPRAEAVNFGVVGGLAFPASTVAGLTIGSETPPKMTVAFFGLTGPSGVLPEFYSQLVLSQQKSADNPERRAFADWLDIFNHRMLSLFYRAWSKYRLPVTYGRANGSQDPVTAISLSLAGLGLPSFVQRLRVESSIPPVSPEDPGVMDEGSLVRYAGLFAHPARSAAGLENMLADYFRTPVSVEQFYGRWRPLSVVNQTRLGRGGQNDELGVSLVIGRRLWDANGGFRIRIGPLDLAEFVSYLPDAVAGRRKLFLLAQLARFYVRASLDFEVRLVLRASEVPVAQLAKGTHGPRLGWNAWVGKRMNSADADDAAFRCSRLLRAHPE